MGWFSKSTDGFFLSTTTPPDIARSQYLGIVHGEAVNGANIFRDMFAIVRDAVGARAGGYGGCKSSFKLQLSQIGNFQKSVSGRLLVMSRTWILLWPERLTCYGAIAI